MKRFRLPAFCLAIILLLSCFTGFCFAESQIELYIDGEKQELNAPCLIEGGVVYIPMEEVFFKMGVYMEWNEKENCYIGEGNNGEIRVTPGLDTAEVDWVPIELPGKVLDVNGVCMIPLYLAEDALRTDPPVYDEQNGRIDIKFPDINFVPNEEVDFERVASTLPEGVEFFGGDDMYNVNIDPSSDFSRYAVFSEVEVEDMPFDKALQIETLPLPNGQVPPSSYTIQQDVYITRGDFESGDVGLMTFWARATKITDESGVAKLRPAVEQVGEWQKASEVEVSITSEWKKYYLPLYSGIYTLKAGASHLTYSVGFKPQIIQLADIKMVNYNQDVSVNVFYPELYQPYKGMEDDHLWKKHAWKRVDKYRKNDMVVNVRDKDGNPIEGANVSVDMTENEFMMGLAIIYNEILGLDDDGEITAKKLDVLDQFNTVIDGLEMKIFECYDSMRRPRRFVNKALEMGKRTRAHALAWCMQDHKGILNFDQMTYEEKCEAYRARMLGEAWMFRGTVVDWDVLNEPHDNGTWRNTYGTGFYSELFQKVKAIDPKAKLFINETGMEGAPNREWKSRVKGFLSIADPMRDDERAPIDGIGIQGHCTNYYYPMGFYWDIANLAKGYDYITITEYDFLNEDMTYAKNHLYDTFLATISHPKTSGFVVWGYQDANHWRGCGPFYDREWNKKDTYDMWKYMVDEVYATHEKLTTDENGKARVRGYRGKYEVTVEVNGVSKVVEFTLTDSDNTERDNWIDITVDGDTITASTPNPHEIYAKHNVPYENHEEAAADYIAKGADKWIGIYRHSDNEGNRIPKTSDGLMTTYVYVEGDGYVEYELVKEAAWGNVNVDFRTPLGEVYDYEILVSEDGENYTSIYKGSSNEDVTASFENAMFVRIQSTGNEYMGISEVNIHAEE